jgi:hypothetical protein
MTHPILKKLRPSTPVQWFIVLWLGGLGACMALASFVKVLLPRVPAKMDRRHLDERTMVRSNYTS